MSSKTKSAFFYFVMDQKAALKSEGRRWSNQQELFEMCGPRWQHASDAERERYPEAPPKRT